MDTTLSAAQQLAIKCAYADLCGIYQTIVRDQNGSAPDHDWKAHRQSIFDLEEAFPFLERVELGDRSEFADVNS